MTSPQEKFVVSKEHASIILRCVPLSFISGLYAIWMDQPLMITSIPFIITCSSILYWSHPTYSWRRNLDIAAVLYTFNYQGYRALYADNSFYYFIFKFLGILSYFVGRYADKYNPYLGVICHTGIHIFTNIGNIILYSGKIY
jgi:hypothetical protein